MSINKDLDNKINSSATVFMAFCPALSFFLGMISIWLSVIISIIWLVLWLKDIDNIKNQGIYVDVWKYVGIIGLFIMPIYFWVRKFRTNTGATLPTLNTVLWTAIFLYNFNHIHT